MARLSKAKRYNKVNSTFRAGCERQRRVAEKAGAEGSRARLTTTLRGTRGTRRARMEVASSASAQKKKSGACAKFRECGSPGSVVGNLPRSTVSGPAWETLKQCTGNLEIPFWRHHFLQQAVWTNCKKKIEPSLSQVSHGLCLDTVGSNCQRCLASRAPRQTTRTLEKKKKG